MYFLNKRTAHTRIDHFSIVELPKITSNALDADHESSSCIEKTIETNQKADHSLFISVKEKIGFSELIIPEYNLSDELLQATMEKWLGLLTVNQIILVFTETPPDLRSRYRFLSEVFFDMKLPRHPNDMQFCFVYDHAESNLIGTDNTYIAKATIESVLSATQIKTIQFLNKRVRLNVIENLSEPELYYMVNQYKQRCEKIINKFVSVSSKRIVENRLIFIGHHETYCCFQDHCSIIRGNWQLDMIPENGSWHVINIQISGIDF